MSCGVMVGHTEEGDPFAGEFDLDMFAGPGGTAVARGEPIAAPVPATGGGELDLGQDGSRETGGHPRKTNVPTQDICSRPTLTDEVGRAVLEPGDVETPEITQMLIGALRAEIGAELAEVAQQLRELREGLGVLKVLRDPGARDDLTIAALDVLADIESSLAHRAAVYAGGPADEPRAEGAQA